jgi:hypothetical protein
MSVTTQPPPTQTTPGQSSSTFQHRVLKLTFKLGTGSFGSTGENTLTVSGLRASATITKVVGASAPAMELVVWGLTLDVMNQLTTVGKQMFSMRNNTVTVEAGYTGGRLSLVYQGLIWQAFADMTGSPETCMVIVSTSNGFAAMKPIAPTSFSGGVDVALIMSSLAAQMADSFENNGVSVILRDPYFWGGAWQQAQMAAKAANINVTLDNGVLAIWPKDGSRGGSVPLISAETGMVGYPRYTDQAVAVSTLFNPEIGFGGNIKIQSILTPANGMWTVKSITHRLSSEMPNSEWFTDLDCSILGAHSLASK